MIPVVITNCAGIDVGKTFITVCWMHGAADAEPELVLRQFSTFNQELAELREWLLSVHCTHIAMESTGSYWTPLFNLLEPHFTILLVKPDQVKARKGHKTDWLDCQWIAHLLRHGLLTGSYVPSLAVRQLRDLTRLRKGLVFHTVCEKNRIQKFLENANVKIGSVLSDVFNVTGQEILNALLDGKLSPAEMADLAKHKARAKIPELTAALEGHRMTDHLRLMLRLCLSHLEFLEKEIRKIDRQAAILIRQNGMTESLDLIKSVTGILDITGTSILAEVGPTVEAFPSDAHLSSWAGLAPGTRLSAGKNKSSRTPKGNYWLRLSLIEAAWAAAHDTRAPLRDLYQRLSTRLGPKQAIVAVAHKLIRLIYVVLSRREPYNPDQIKPMSEAKRTRLIRHHVRSLGRLGITVRGNHDRSAYEIEPAKKNVSATPKPATRSKTKPKEHTRDVR
jgi:transposase